MFGVGPFSESGLDEAFCLSIGSWGVGSCTAMFDLHLLADGSELMGSVAASVVCQQSTYLNAFFGEEGDRFAQEGDGGFCFLIREYSGKRGSGVVVDGHMQGQ